MIWKYLRSLNSLVGLKILSSHRPEKFFIALAIELLLKFNTDNGPSMMDQWMVCVTFGQSIYEVVSNDNETTISQCVIVYVRPVPKNVRLWFQILQSVGNCNRWLSGNAAKPYLSYFKLQSAWLEYLKAQLHSLESSRDMRDLQIRCFAMNRGPVSVSQLFNSIGK